MSGKVLVSALALTCLLAGCASLGGNPEAPPKKLIEFGWDEPSTTFMRQHRVEMEAMPFDGCVFHVDYKKTDGSAGQFIWELWGTPANIPWSLPKMRRRIPGNPCMSDGVLKKRTMLFP